MGAVHVVVWRGGFIAVWGLGGDGGGWGSGGLPAGAGWGEGAVVPVAVGALGGRDVAAVFHRGRCSLARGDGGPASLGGVTEFAAVPALGGGGCSPHDVASSGAGEEADAGSNSSCLFRRNRDDDRDGGFGGASGFVRVEKTDGGWGDSNGQAQGRGQDLL